MSSASAVSRPRGLSERAWALLVLAAAAACAGLLAWAFASFYRLSDPATAGSLVMVASPSDKDGLRTIRRLAPQSPVAVAGGRVGDRIAFDRSADGYRQLSVDESIGLTLLGAAGAPPRHLVVRPLPDPRLASHPIAFPLSGWLDLANHALWLAAGALLAWRRPGRGPLRTLALVFVVSSANALTPYLPAGYFITEVNPWLNHLTWCWISAGFLYFCLTYPGSPPPWDRPAVRRAFYAFAMLSLAARVWAALANLNSASSQIGPLDVTSTLQTLYFVGNAGAILPLAMAWRSSTGLARQRLAWITLSLGSINSAAAVAPLVGRLGIVDPIMIKLFWSATQAAGTFGVTYALLTKRLFDFGFALNRVAVYALTGLGLVGAAVVLQASIDAGLGAASHGWHLAAAVGLGLMLLGLLAPLRKLSERAVQLALYPHWRSNQAALERAIGDAATVRGREGLLAHYLEALRRYSGGATSAVYRCDDGRCSRLAGDLPAAETFVAGDGELRQLLAGRMPRMLESAAGDNGLVLPLTHRDQLTGVVVMGGKPDQRWYRPDEVSALRHAVARLDDARAWLRPFWDQPGELGPEERAAVSLGLVNAISGLGPEWLPRLEAASTAYTREGAVALAVGCALAERQLWGKARRSLEQAANDTLLASAPRRKAWLALATLAQQEGDDPRAARCFEAAARLV